jgi:hypothetical protein
LPEKPYKTFIECKEKEDSSKIKGRAVLPPVQNIVGICKQITILILHYVTSRLVTPLEALIPL